MVTAAAPLSICLRPTDILSDAKVEARKRRREVRASQRGGISSSDVFVDDDVVVTGSSSNVALLSNNFTEANKRMKVTSMNSDASSDCSCTNEPLFTSKKSASLGKKQQMKYDPDVPMTKEEAAKWRREQRRKRNRESAAASRQRQRDRITELEVHVENWKLKFEDVMTRIAHLEKLKKEKSTLSSSSLDADSSKNNIPLNSTSQLIGSDSDDDDNNHIHHHIHQPEIDPIINEHTIVGVDMEISPLSSISRDLPVNIVSDVVISASSAISSSSLLEPPVPNPLSSFDTTSRATLIGIVPVSGDEEEEDMLLPSNMISRPAALFNNHSFQKPEIEKRKHTKLPGSIL